VQEENEIMYDNFVTFVTKGTQKKGLLGGVHQLHTNKNTYNGLYYGRLQSHGFEELSQ
jgi:hypothetical protein